MADKDETWDGPVEEASVPMGERLETLEAGGAVEEVTEAFPPIEERVARLERIAEYLHDARREAASLAHSVDTLADATKALTSLLAAVEAQQKRIEALDEKIESAATETEASRSRGVRRSWIVGACFAALLTLGGVLFVFQERTTGRIEAESFARGVANCEASNESRQGIRDFIMAVFQIDDGAPPDERAAEIVRLSEEAFPLRDCDAELVEVSEGAGE